MLARDGGAAGLAGHNSGTLHLEAPQFAPQAPLIGRSAELAEVTGLLSDSAVRLVTITGRGGVGKTRLATEAAQSLNSRRPGSVSVVSLASVTDPELVLAAIAAQLDVSAGPGVPLKDVVVRWLRRTARVLVLDNFEHLLAATDQLLAIIGACPGLQVLVTSQTPLRLAAERVVDLAPLALPELLTTEPGDVELQPAVSLYCDRARAANHQFRLNQANVAGVVSLCRELEGLPLAIELAAARATTLPAADLAKRLTERRLDVLRSARPDAPARHHDMRASIGWTYNLLTGFQRRLLRRVSVAGGAFDIDDAEALGSAEGLGDVIDALSALVDFHLLTPVSADGMARFELAPSIRDFAAEELRSSGEAEDIEVQWIRWLANRARTAAEGLTAQAPDAWWVWLEGEHDCLRNALQKCLDLSLVGPSLDLVSALAPYWDARAAHSAHSRLLDRAIDLADQADDQSAAHAEALLWSGLLGIRVLVTDTADRYVERLKCGEERARQLGDDRLIMLAAHCRALTTVMTGDVERGIHATGEGLQIARSGGEDCWISRFEVHTARWAMAGGNEERAVALGISALQAGRRAEDSRGVLNAAFLLQTLAPSYPAAATALPPPQELLTMARSTHQRLSEAILLPLLAVQSLAAGDVTAAAAWCAAALDISGFDPTSYPAGYALFAAVEIAGRQGDHELAARIHGRLQDTRARLHAAMSANFVTANLAAVEAVRAALGADAFDRATATGTGMPWDATVAEVSGYLTTLTQPTPPGTREPLATARQPVLTDRQLQVIQLLATGRTNKEIARQLGLTPKTVMHHTVAIYQRLGVRGRSEAVAWAIQAGVAPAGLR